MSRTFCCPLASVSARLIAVVDLPSPGTALVTTNVFGGSSTSRNCRFVRSIRNDSSRGACESRLVMSGFLPAFESYWMPPSTARPVDSVSV